MEFDYEAQQDDELSLTVGDIIVNIRRDDGGWWEGELGGRRGLFPDNFVRVSNRSQPQFMFLLLCSEYESQTQSRLSRNSSKAKMQCVTALWVVSCVFVKSLMYILT